MRRERRLIWSEDRYQLLGCDGLDRYCGRIKGDFYFVYRKRGDSVRREIVQVVEGEQDWFWDTAKNRLVNDESVSVVSESKTLEPNEHVLRGYLNSNRIEDLTQASVDGSRTSFAANEILLKSGASVILLSPRSDSSSDCEWVISLHGGPESLEGTEIRYGGLYRELLRQGFGVAILNYRGSTGIEKPASISWKTSIQEDFDSLMSVLSSANPVKLLGASFGGALALLLSETRQVRKTLLISPLLDLIHQRERGGDEFRAWFDSKFSEVDFQDISLAALVRGISKSSSEIGLIYGEHDEVLGQEMFSWLAVVLRSANSSGIESHHVVHRHGGAHQPVGYRDVTSQLVRSYEFLTESTDTVC